MKAIVDSELCSGCELCVEICPEVFEMDGDIAKVKVDTVSEDAIDCCNRLQRIVQLKQ